MNTTIRHIALGILLSCYVLLSFGGQFAVLRSLINSSTASAIASETGKSSPLDMRVVWTQGKYIAPAQNSENEPAIVGDKHLYCDPVPEKIHHDHPFYTILISHFPYPPFWPRDPSLS